MFSDGFALVVYAVSAEERWSLCMVHVERGAWRDKKKTGLVPSLPSLPKVLTGMWTTVLWEGF